MGIETALIAAGVGAQTAAAVTSFSGVLSALSAASSIVGGIQGMQAGKQQAKQAEFQAGQAATEQVRQSERQAAFERQNIDSTTRRQKLAYLKSGVSLEGSPLLVMEETRRKGADNVNEILQGGKAASMAALTEGRLQASQLKSSGRNAFISGLTNGGGQLAKVFA